MCARMLQRNLVTFAKARPAQMIFITTSSRAFGEAGQLLKIRDCPGDSGTVGDYGSVYDNLLDMARFKMKKCYFSNSEMVSVVLGVP